MFRGTKETLLIRWCSWCKSTTEKEEFAISAEEKKTRVSWAMVCVCFECQANIINIISFGGGMSFHYDPWKLGISKGSHGGALITVVLCRHFKSGRKAGTDQQTSGPETKRCPQSLCFSSTRCGPNDTFESYANFPLWGKLKRKFLLE